ncbi:helix-turn-helix transcriptional regulator [Morganella morganii]|uniref:helix-turn-helix domain-containing protein n=1 Tax=Morganella morganii TaxID=582 RepID=UPI0031EB7ED1
MSGEKLGFTLEISQQQVSRYELGKGNLTVSLLFRILTALDISLIVFLNELRKQYDSSDTVHTLLDIDNLLFLNKNINKPDFLL